MSGKHNQRTRAEILAKRGQMFIMTENGFKNWSKTPVVMAFNDNLSRSKYQPHTGKKQEAKASGEYYQNKGL